MGRDRPRRRRAHSGRGGENPSGRVGVAPFTPSLRQAPISGPAVLLPFFLLAFIFLFLPVNSPLLTGPARAADGTCGMAVNEPSTQWYFAEGYTGAGFQEWLCVFNPNPEPAELQVDFLYNGAPPASIHAEIPPFYRSTLNINHLAGEGKELSLRLAGDRPLVAERPIYFLYANKWKGCTLGQGVTSPSARWYFAEGCTREGFEEYLLLANPTGSEVAARARFTLENGLSMVHQAYIPPHSRWTIFVNHVVGSGHDVTAEVEAEGPVCAERVMYFDYRGAWCGGHASTGLTTPREKSYFAEGYTGTGFDEWLCLYWPWEGGETEGENEVQVRCLYQGGGEDAFTFRLQRGQRSTVNVNQLAGSGKELSLEVTGSHPLVAERPMYFNYLGSCRGGHVSTGTESPGLSWLLGEGTTRPGFHPYLCILNTSTQQASVRMDFALGDGGSQSVESVIPASSRYTLNVLDVLPRGTDFSMRLTSDRPVVVERPLYFPGADFEVLNAMDHILNLSVGIGPRVEGTAGEERAAAYLASVLAGYGYHVLVQEVPLPNGARTRNVIASLEDAASDGSPGWRQALVVGGHFDTKGGTGSPGANDNASGTAVVLELARCLAERGPLPGLRLEFVLFGGEELLVDGTDLHHFGSRYYVAALTPEERSALRGAVVVDMVGVGTQLYARTMGIGPMDLCNALLSYAAGSGTYLPYLQSGSYSDHEPFEKAGIPAVWLEVKDDPWYHTPMDSYDKIDPRHVEVTGRLLLGFILSLGS